MGDVLTGLLGGLCARGMDSVHATCTAAFVHGFTGSLVADQANHGWSIRASQVAEALPNVFGLLMRGAEWNEGEQETPEEEHFDDLDSDEDDLWDEEETLPIKPRRLN
jgi:hypothetical protein